MMTDDTDLRLGEEFAAAAPEKPASGKPEQNKKHRYEGRPPPTGLGITPPLSALG
jgi:hypothetical protein